MGEFSLLSLNTFGLPLYMGWGRLRRMARELNRLPATAICLQEVQQNAYVALLQRGLPDYPHHLFERHHFAPRGGLALFSRLPFAGRRFEVYQDRGGMFSISFIERLQHKGIQLAYFEIENLPVFVLNTHMNANYGGVWHPANHLTRILHSQVQQLNQAIHFLPQDALILICGDLNFPRNSFLYEELIAHNHLFDPLRDDPRATYRPFPLAPAKWNTSLDYVLVRRPAGMSVRAQADLLPIEDTAKQHPVQRFLTDHNALVLHVQWDSTEGR
jgi:endonuclease/exonuclease/phosphatase family metal-dependent hydrolase